MRRILNPLTRPAHISPKKKVKWRLIKKWFNRYGKAVCLKQMIMATTKDGRAFYCKITSVKINKAGGHRQDYSFDLEPISEVKNQKL